MNRKSNHLLLLATAALFLFVLPGCKKACEEFKSCNIEKLKVYDPVYPTEGVFAYNAYGNPVSITFNHLTEARPNYEFRYNASQRLTDFIRPYDNGHFDSWTKYYYDGSNRIIKDTVYIFGHTGATPTGYSDVIAGSYEYDGQGRISKYTSRLLADPSATEYHDNYSYNAAGNLVRPAITYDDKLSIYRTNKIWMFLNRNYSVNNAFIADTYNTNGLPVQIRPSGVVKGYANEPRFLDQPIQNADVEYSCK